MNKHVFFLANDPGGYDVIYPVFAKMQTYSDIGCSLWLTGAAGDKNPIYKVEFEYIKSILIDKSKSIDSGAIVTGTSWNSNVETEIIRLGRYSGLVTISILDYWTNYNMRFYDGNDYIYPDYLFVMDELALKEAQEDGVLSSFHIIGHPGLDKFLTNKILGKNFERIEKNEYRVLVLSQPIEAVYGDTLGFSEEEVLNDIEKACVVCGHKLSVLFHPKDLQNIKDSYSKYHIEGSIIDLAPQYDVVISMITIGLLQCHLMGVPIVSYQPHPSEKDFCITDRIGITNRVTSYSDLVEALATQQYSINYEKLPNWFDGQASSRGVEKIRELI